MIWHVYEPAGLASLDCELAHGMWNRDPVTCSTTTENRFYGEDSLDLREFPCGYAYPNLASATCWWNFQTKNTFDGLSNPSSDYYGNAVFNGIQTQDRPTHLAVRKIQGGNFSTATADLLVNNWYGHITANTTWGPNKVYAITGDIIVDSGKTLTIDSCTTIHFQANEDNQKSLPDTAKSALVVKPGGTLIIKGTKNYPAKFLSSKPETVATNWDWEGIVVKPGGVFACSNAVIRHAYAGIEDESEYSHTIKNVRIGKCKMYGILAINTDSLTIRGCRVDSVRDSVMVDTEFLLAPWEGQTKEPS